MYVCCEWFHPDEVSGEPGVKTAGWKEDGGNNRGGRFQFRNMGPTADVDIRGPTYPPIQPRTHLPTHSLHPSLPHPLPHLGPIASVTDVEIICENGARIGVKRAATPGSWGNRYGESLKVTTRIPTTLNPTDEDGRRCLRWTHAQPHPQSSLTVHAVPLRPHSRARAVAPLQVPLPHTGSTDACVTTILDWAYEARAATASLWCATHPRAPSTSFPFLSHTILILGRKDEARVNKNLQKSSKILVVGCNYTRST